MWLYLSSIFANNLDVGKIVIYNGEKVYFINYFNIFY